MFYYLGRLQASEVGRQLKAVGVTKILCSPLIRTVQSADLIAEQLGLGENSICVEMGLVEEAKSFRGKTASEPRPNWDPLILPLSELMKFSTRIDPNYQSLHIVRHVKDESKPNTIAEVHESLTDRDQITRDRYRQVFQKLVQADFLQNETVLCVGHGATVLSCIMVMEKDLPEEEKIKGERCVSCFAEFRPVDPSNLLGPWKSVTGEWGSGNIFGESAEDLADRG